MLPKEILCVFAVVFVGQRQLLQIVFILLLRVCVPIPSLTYSHFNLLAELTIRCQSIFSHLCVYSSRVKQRRIKHIEDCRTLQELRGCRKRRLVVGTIWCHFYMKHIFGYCCIYLRKENGGALCRFQRVI